MTWTVTVASRVTPEANWAGTTTFEVEAHSLPDALLRIAKSDYLRVVAEQAVMTYPNGCDLWPAPCRHDPAHCQVREPVS